MYTLIFFLCFSLNVLTVTNSEYLCSDDSTSENVQWRLLNDKCFALVEKTLNSNEAQTECESLSGQLAEITTNEVKNFVRTDVIGDSTDFVWVAKNKLCNTTTTECAIMSSDSNDTCKNCKDKLQSVCEKSAQYKNSKGCALPDGMSDLGWVVTEEKCYHIQMEEVHYDVATTRCGQYYNGKVAIVRTREEGKALMRMFGVYPDVIAWVQHVDGNRQDCAMASVSVVYWTDIKCNMPLFFICEVARKTPSDSV